MLAGSVFAGLLRFIPGLLAAVVVVLFCRKESVCALGSSVELSCGLEIQETRSKLKEFYWFNNDNMKKWKDTTIPEDLIKDPEYGGHLRSGGVGGSRQYSHTLKISDLTEGLR